MSLYKNCGWWKNFDCIFEFSVKSYVTNIIKLSCAKIFLPSVICARRKESWTVNSTYPLLERFLWRFFENDATIWRQAAASFCTFPPDNFVMTVKCLVVNRGLVIRWPLRSPDLTPADFRRRRFQGFKENVSADVNALVPGSFDCCFPNCTNM
jgi:hypothetical protein